MEPSGKRLLVENREQWREWLQANHSTETELWLIFLKKHVKKPCIGYEEAVEEALCFGWIDGLTKSIDGESYMLRFSPRKKSSVWSEPNKKRVRKMIEQGRMTEAGLAKVELAKQSGEWDKVNIREDIETPDDVKEALQLAGAQANFDRLSPSCRKQYLGWITETKKPETRQRRIAEAVKLIQENKKLGMK